MNPYDNIRWETTEYLHSFSHQHVSPKQLPEMWEIGYRHFPVSNYYPSKPLYPLPETFRRMYPEALGAPNAEQHSTTDNSIHFNAIGSYYTTGYGQGVKTPCTQSPVEHCFTGLHVFDPAKEPWRGTYRLDLVFEPVDGGRNPAVTLTIDDAVQVTGASPSHAEIGFIRDRLFTRKVSSANSLWLRTLTNQMRVRVVFDPATTRITRFRLMQGTNRPWRDAFKAALDGSLRDASGQPIEGLMYPDGGGITINHPSASFSNIVTMLDFDPRVLGIEVWNHRRLFGGRTLETGRQMPWYTMWDEVLRSGRRCFGFFVKDHRSHGRGRNVLLIPGGVANTAEHERHALRAYRDGCFFGMLGAIKTDRNGKPVPPYDFSAFRFTKIALVRQNGEAVALDVSVDGADEQQRPNTQIRFITEKGIARVVNAKTARFPLSRAPGTDPASLLYVRVEAFAYPSTHMEDQPLSAAAVSDMNVFQIARLHNVSQSAVKGEFYPGAEAPLGIVDMIFSQPIFFR